MPRSLGFDPRLGHRQEACLKLLSLEVICYAVIASSCTLQSIVQHQGITVASHFNSVNPAEHRLCSRHVVSGSRGFSGGPGQTPPSRSSHGRGRETQRGQGESRASFMGEGAFGVA